MDPLVRTSLIIVVVVAIRMGIYAAWGRFVHRQSSAAMPTKQINGVYRPWGTVEKVRHWGWRLTQLWLTILIALLIALAYARFAPAGWP